MNFMNTIPFYELASLLKYEKVLLVAKLWPRRSNQSSTLEILTLLSNPLETIDTSILSEIHLNGDSSFSLKNRSWSRSSMMHITLSGNPIMTPLFLHGVNLEIGNWWQDFHCERERARENPCDALLNIASSDSNLFSNKSHLSTFLFF